MMGVVNENKKYIPCQLDEYMLNSPLHIAEGDTYDWSYENIEQVAQVLFSDIHKFTVHCGSSCHCRADQVRPRTFALTAFKVTVGSRSTVYASRHFIRVHPQASRASWLAPFKSRIDENFVQSQFRGRIADGPASRSCSRAAADACRGPCTSSNGP